MDPDAALRTIDEADRVDAEVREAMAGLHGWLSRGGFAPDWDAYPTGTRRYRKAYGKSTRRAHARIAAADKPRRHHAQIQIGDIVQRSDVASKNRYVVVNIQQPWIYTRRISGSGGPGVITFPSEIMLRKVS